MFMIARFVCDSNYNGLDNIQSSVRQATIVIILIHFHRFEMQQQLITSYMQHVSDHAVASEYRCTLIASIVAVTRERTNVVLSESLESKFF